MRKIAPIKAKDAADHGVVDRLRKDHDRLNNWEKWLNRLLVGVFFIIAGSATAAIITVAVHSVQH